MSSFFTFILIILEVCMPNGANAEISPSASNFGYYDQLRKNGTDVTAAAIFNQPTHVGRNIHRVDTTSPLLLEDGQHHDSLLFCHVPIYLRYSNELGPSCQVANSASAGALLAMHHFNSGDGIVVPDLEGINERCNIRLTTEIVDSGSSPINAFGDMTQMITRPPGDFANPQPCAIFGSQISAVTSRLASLTGVFDLFQVSSSAMSTELENPQQYPLLARSHTDVAGFGEMSISYLKESLGINSFGVLVPNDAYGLGFQKSIIQAATADEAMSYVTAQYNPGLNSPEEMEADIRSALQVFKDSEYNYFVAAFYPELFAKIMGVAYEMNLAGDGKFWLITGTVSLAPFTLSGKLVAGKDSPAAKAISGNGIILCKGGLPGIGGSYDRFTNEWQKLGESRDALDYMNSKQPSLLSTDSKCKYEADFFKPLPHHHVTFSYDAVVGLGLAACKAQTNETEVGGVFTGKMQRDVFARNTFRGASGDIHLRKDFPTRTADSSYFVMLNLAAKTLNDTHITFKGSPLKVFWDTDKRQWKARGDEPFLYSGGLQSPPPDYQEEALPPVDYNHLTGIRPVGLALFVIAASASIVCGIWTHVYRNSRVAKASQPFFLGLICVGCLVMSSAIIPLSIDESIASPEGCSKACKSIPWLLSIGFTTVFSALFSKIWRVNQVMHNSSRMRHVTIKEKDVMMPFIVLMTINVALLMGWTLVDPMMWHRTKPENYQSYGYCSSEGRASIGFLVSIAIVNVSALVLANVQAFRARNIATEYSESLYVFITMMSLLQALFIGIPLIVLSNEIPVANYFAWTGIIFVITMATLGLMFIPKILLVRQRTRGQRSSLSGYPTAITPIAFRRRRHSKNPVSAPSPSNDNLEKPATV